MADALEDDNVDLVADEEIKECLNFNALKSFFLFAGAGSGKTRSLVNAIDHLRSAKDPKKTNRNWLQVRGKKIAVITFTRAAKNEILERTQKDPLVVVNTIHSFAWLLIKDHQSDIRAWLKHDLKETILGLEVEQAKRTRTNTKVYADTARSILSKRERLAKIDEVPKFVYSPDGQNEGRDSLNHAEVIKIVTSFLSEKSTVQKILVDGFPVLLIDESQDTNRLLLEALLNVEKKSRGRFSLGLIGDTMQRIYADGHKDLGKVEFIPKEWKKPAKKMNHRSEKRIVDLANRIRASVDDQVQQSRKDKPGGTVRFFIIDRLKQSDPAIAENTVRNLMAKETGDNRWISEDVASEDNLKTLILEHHMAAARQNFSELFDPLYQVSNETFRTSLLDGSLPGLRFFCADVWELFQAVKDDDDFAIARIVQDKSPILDKTSLISAATSQKSLLEKANKSIEELKKFLNQSANPTLAEILNLVSRENLLNIPRSLLPFIQQYDADWVGEGAEQEESEEERDVKSEYVAWRSALEAKLSQAIAYDTYISGQSEFDTHQGVKGLEFPRVMVIINDKEARGFQFSYDKLFGAKERSKTDKENESTGLDNAIARTRRLLYVTATRAKESLAIVLYTDNVEAVQKNATDEKLFEENEIHIIE